MSDKKSKKKGDKKKEEGKKKWKCKKHKINKHDIFINYRVRTDKDLAIKLFYALSAEIKEDGKAYRPFLDAECLNDGEEWETGFLNGLKTAAVILLIISEDGIKGIEGAHNYQDNVLLEYEYALDKQDKGEAVILPLMVGKNVDGGLYKPFGAFGVSQYNEGKHKSGKSTRESIRATMETLFKIQGLKTDPNSLGDRIKDICAKTSDVLKQYKRMGDAKTTETHNDKWVSEWTVKDVLAWLKEAGLEEFSDKFKENAVDGTTLMALDEETLNKELGVTKKLHVIKILKYIEKQKEDEQEADFDADDEEDDDGEDDGEGGDDGEEGGDGEGGDDE